VSGAAPQVVVVGSVNRDYVCRVETLPAPGQTVIGGAASVGSGGKGGNQAVAASLAGARTVIVACVGDDAGGKALVADLAAAGVDTSAVRVVPDVTTGMAFVMVAADGENSIVVAPGANSRVEPDAAAATVRTLLEPPAVLVTQAEIPQEVVEAVVAAASERGCRAVVNLAPYRPVAGGLLRLADPLVVNESEVGALLGRDVHGAASAAAAASELVDRGVPSVVVTVGREGAVLAAPGLVEQVPAADVDVVDTTGAGDAFTGALAAVLSGGAGLPEAVRVGVRAGSYAVTRAGAQSSYPTAQELGLRPLG
jgi:ribokinase